MSQRSKTLEILADYFIQKGKFLSRREYLAELDTPIRARLVQRKFSSWARIEGMIQKNFPDKYAQICGDEVDVEKLEEAEELVKAQEPIIEKVADKKPVTPFKKPVEPKDEKD